MYDKIRTGCTHCNKESRVSIGEKAIAFYLEEAGLEVIESDRKILGGKELDVYLPRYKIAIEYDGKEYHQDSNRDYAKIRLCKRAGIDLIRVREQGCPTLIGVRVIEVKPSDYTSLGEGIKELLKSLKSQYGISSTVKVDMNRDLQRIIEKKYSAKKESSIGVQYKQIATMLQSKINPNVIPSKSNIYFDWKCPDCGNVWNAPVYSIVNSFKNGNTGCNVCAGGVLVKGKNDAATKDPIATSLYDAERNGDELSDHIFSDESVKTWRCIECGKSFDREIFVMCRKGSTHACEICSKLIAGRNRRMKLRKSGDNLLVKCP